MLNLKEVVEIRKRRKHGEDVVVRTWRLVPYASDHK
jgi:hypothetical protein